MAKVTLGDMVVFLNGDSSGLDNMLVGARRRIGDFEHHVGDLAKKIRNLFGIVLGAMAARGLFRFAAAQGAIIDEQAKLADRLQMTLTQLRGLEFAADLSGASMENLMRVLEYLERAIGNAALGMQEPQRALQALGIELDEIRAMDVADQFLLVAQRISDLKRASDKAAVSQYLFGRGAFYTLTLLNEGQKGITAMMERQKYVEGELDRGTYARYVEILRDSYDSLKRSINSVMQHLLVRLAPAATRVLEGMIRGVVRVREAMIEHWPYIADVGQKVFEWILDKGITAYVGLEWAVQHWKQATEYALEFISLTFTRLFAEIKHFFIVELPIYLRWFLTTTWKVFGAVGNTWNETIRKLLPWPVPGQRAIDKSPSYDRTPQEESKDPFSRNIFERFARWLLPQWVEDIFDITDRDLFGGEGPGYQREHNAGGGSAFLGRARIQPASMFGGARIDAGATGTGAIQDIIAENIENMRRDPLKYFGPGSDVLDTPQSGAGPATAGFFQNLIKTLAFHFRQAAITAPQLPARVIGEAEKAQAQRVADLALAIGESMKPEARKAEIYAALGDIFGPGFALPTRPGGMQEPYGVTFGGAGAGGRWNNPALLRGSAEAYSAGVAGPLYQKLENTAKESLVVAKQQTDVLQETQDIISRFVDNLGIATIGAS